MSTKQKVFMKKMTKQLHTPSVFQRYRECLDSVKVGEVLKRKGVREAMPDVFQSVTDKYRRMFELASYVKYVKDGEYIKLRELGEDTKTSVSLKLTYEKFKKATNFFDDASMSAVQITERKLKWKDLWDESGLSIDEFLHKYRGKLASEKFNL